MLLPVELLAFPALCCNFNRQFHFPVLETVTKSSGVLVTFSEVELLFVFGMEKCFLMSIIQFASEKYSSWNANEIIVRRISYLSTWKPSRCVGY